MGGQPWVRFSRVVGAAGVLAGAAVMVLDERVDTRALALVSGTAAMALLDAFPITFRRGQASRRYTTVIEVGFGFAATWSTPLWMVLATGVASIPVLVDRRLARWRRHVSSGTLLLSAAPAALVLGSVENRPAAAGRVIAACGAFALASAVVTILARSATGEPTSTATERLRECATATAFGVGGGTLGWVLALAIDGPSPGPAASVVALAIVVGLCVVMSRDTVRTDALQSTVRALSDLGTVDDEARLRHHLGEDASALVRGAMRITLVDHRPQAGEWVEVPRHPGSWLRVERHPAADPLLDEEREQMATIAALVAGSLDRVGRLREARRQAETDPMTGALNRRGLATMLGALESRAVVVGLDIDDLKMLNDVGGHDVGDAAIVALVERLRSRLRAGDLLARTGGDEFVVVMPNTQLDEAAAVIDAALHPPPTVSSSGGPHEVTASWGTAAFDPAQQGSIDEVLKSADEALYESKRQR